MQNRKQAPRNTHTDRKCRAAIRDRIARREYRVTVREA